MKRYRLTFVNNEVIDCREDNAHHKLTGKYQYEHDHGRLIFAIVSAENEDSARSISSQILSEITRNAA